MQNERYTIIRYGKGSFHLKDYKRVTLANIYQLIEGKYKFRVLEGGSNKDITRDTKIRAIGKHLYFKGEELLEDLPGIIRDLSKLGGG